MNFIFPKGVDNFEIALKHANFWSGCSTPFAPQTEVEHVLCIIFNSVLKNNVSILEEIVWATQIV